MTARERASIDVLHTMDAQVWAQEFMRRFAFRKQDIDESLMLCWFANAIMKGFDEANRRNASALADERRRVWEEAALAIVKRHKSTDSDKWLDLASEMKTCSADGFNPQARPGRMGDGL